MTKKIVNHTDSFIRTIGVCALTTSLLVPLAQAQVSANVALQSDYVWRGISQNQQDPAIQGGFDYEHESGFYVGVWGSSVDFSAAESTELDVYGGWNTELQNGLGIDLGVIEYSYHGGDGASDSNFTEAYVGLSHSGFSFYYYAGDEFDDLIEAGYSYKFESGFSLATSYGAYDAYSYYNFGVSTEIGGIGVDLTYWDTDINNDDFADGRVVFTLSKEL